MKNTGIKRTDHMPENVMTLGSVSHPKNQATWKATRVTDHGQSPKRNHLPKRDNHSVPGECPANNGERYARESGIR
jgi:hypothetical protein